MTRGREDAATTDVRILLAEDDPAMRAWVARVLTTALRASVREVGDGVELVSALLDEGPFDLVITDVRMPWLDGGRAMLAARRAGLPTAFLVVSAFADAELREQIEAVPGARLLEKPFSTGELVEAVTQRLAAAG